jgi:peptidoglycan/LPS O-acetylase OafA/YrhL
MLPPDGETVPVFAGTTIATLGVKIFFVVSGYLVAQSWLRDPHPRRFLQRRLLRIVPALVLVVVLTASRARTRSHQPPDSGLSRGPRTWLYLANLAFYPADELPGVFAANAAPHEVNGSLWSLPPELSMYLLLPLLAGVSLALSGAYRLFIIAACLVTLCGLLVVLPARSCAHGRFTAPACGPGSRSRRSSCSAPATRSAAGTVTSTASSQPVCWRCLP